MAKSQTISNLEQLRLRLEEAEETIEAIRSGKIDALVVSGPQGEQIYTLHGADHSYRVLLEDMNEGAATLLPDGAVLYCNRAFADMLKLPIEKVIRFAANDLVAQSDRRAFAEGPPPLAAADPGTRTRPAAHAAPGARHRHPDRRR